MSNLQDDMLSAIETILQQQVDRLAKFDSAPFQEMLTYHMGWTGEGSGKAAQGKRIRPLLLLLTCAASGADWRSALPAAAGVELIHNFSLIHDDIQDNSSLRRGRDTVWVKWGIPQGINAGDAMFVIANQSILDLSPVYPADTVLKASDILLSTCLHLTHGQYLDMSYEERLDPSTDDYWGMVSGKTAALLSSCCAIGSLLGNSDDEDQAAWCSFGHYLGLAFQVQDDYLGIWGDPDLLGKSVESDLVTGKKSLPVLYGLEKKGEFYRRWIEGSIQADEVPWLADKLAAEGVQLKTREMVDRMSDLALGFLRAARPQGEGGEALYALFDRLLERKS